MPLKIHHLRVGRSVFTVWLLEELGLQYEMEIYDRNEMGRAPPELKEIHPLGKSPVIEVDGTVLAETTAIAMYLVETRDGNRQFTYPGTDEARAEWLYWMQYPEGSAFAPLLFKLLLSREQDPKPPLISMFAEAEVTLHLDYIRDSLGDKDYILGDKLQLPDFGLTYIVSMAHRLELLENYPTLRAYLERNVQRPAFTRAMAKTGG